MGRSARLVGAVVMAALAVALIAHHHLQVRRAAMLRIDVVGGDGGSLPLAQPDLEHFDAAALERAARDRVADGLRAFVVMRHGHVVFERFTHGTGADTQIDIGPSAQVLVALLAGITTRDGTVALPVLGRFDPSAWRDTIEHATGEHYAQVLSRRVWAPLNAASAWIAVSAPGAVVPVDCCFHARVQDWLRLGALLADGGNFEGTQVVDAKWVERMRQPANADGSRGLGVELGAGAHGSAPFESADVVFMRGRGRWRLWAVPRLHLVVLFGSDAGGDAARTARTSARDTVAGQGMSARPVATGWDETRLPDLVIEAVTDRTAPQNPASPLDRLVPHHS